eukprot:scaffold145479_cov105-Phaeocystis_antarctica.AAC.1
MEVSSAFLATPSAGWSCSCSAVSRPTAKPEPKRAPATTRPARLTSTSLTTELFFTFFVGVAANISCGARCTSCGHGGSGHRAETAERAAVEQW